LVLVIHDCLLRARSLSSVNPTVRRVRDLAELVSDSLMLASVFVFFDATVAAFWPFLVPNTEFRRFLIIGFP
jgi:hypothetical protein